MSKRLGIGVRVWCNWCAPEEVYGGDFDPRLKHGVIADGPHLPGEVVYGYIFKEKKWKVLIDGGEFAVSEDMLTPIDDGEESVTRLAELENDE